MEKRIDLEKFQEWWENANDPDMGELEDIIHGYPIMLRELKRMYEIEDELVEILSILEDRHGVDMSQFFERDASE